jgi:PAS domain S-box-containing protein
LKPAAHLIHANVFRAVVETAPEAVIIVDNGNRIVFANKKASEVFGYPPEEILLQEISLLVSPAAKPNEAIDSSGFPPEKENADLNLPREAVGINRSGQPFLVELSSSGWEEQDRSFTFYTIRDISSRRKKIMELELLLETTEAISQAADFDSAIGITIRKVCEITGWEFGEAWIPDRQGKTISYSPQWFAASESLHGFARECAAIVLQAGESMAGRVVLNAVEWCPDVSAVPEEKFMRQKLALKYDLRAGLGVPITSDGEVLAALVFFMRESRVQDLTLTKAVTSVAKQLGSVLKRKIVQEQLKESETKYRTIFEKSTDPVMLLADEKLIDCNQATVEILRAEKKEDILSLHPAALSPAFQPDGQPSLDKARAMMEKAAKNGWHRYEWMYRRKTGERFWAEVSLTAIPFEKEQIFHTVWHDITARKLAEENLEKEREYLGAILENVEDGIVGCDENGTLSFFNRATRQFHGLPEEPLQPEEWGPHYGLYGADGRTPLSLEEIPLYKAYQGQVVQNVEMVIIPKSGKTRHVLCSGRKITSPSGKSLGAVVVMHDVTNRKRTEKELDHKNQVISLAYEELKTAEKELIRANNELEERVQKRTEELSAKNRELYSKNLELVSMNNDLDNFVYIASHDLKVPLLNMEALLGILRNELVQDNPESQFVFRKFMQAIKRMKQTIQDITEVAKAQRKQTERPERVLFQDVLQEVKSSLENLITSTNARIREDFSEAPSLLYSQINLKSILYNLVSNALLYRSPERQPEITLRTHCSDGFLVLTVQDNGLGMNLDRGIDKLFAMFTRLHTHVEGSGIGLYIVNRLVQNQGGRVEVESEVGQGSTFRIYFKDAPAKS